MSKSNVNGPEGRETIEDPVTELLRVGAQQLIQRAVEAELAELLSQHGGRRTETGNAGVVRNGYLPERELQTGLGPVTVQIPKVRAKTGEAVTFRSALVPPYIRKTKSLEAAVPWLYLKGVSSGEMGEALKVLVGPQAQGLSASTVSRLKQVWGEQYRLGCEERLDADRWVYVWADGIYSGLRAEQTKLCALVVIGVNERGEKRFLAIEDGVRESTQSWREVLLKLKSRGMNVPKLAIGDTGWHAARLGQCAENNWRRLRGFDDLSKVIIYSTMVSKRHKSITSTLLSRFDGAMGFWAALEEIYPETRQQRCWMHKVMNVLNCLPKSVQAKAKQALHSIWQAETKADAEKAFDLFIETYEPKYPKATLCLQKDREELLAFYDFPAKHWQSIRTTNPIESTFATIRHRTKRSRGCLTRDGMLHMMFKLGQCAENNWRRLRGFDDLSKVIIGVKFNDGANDTRNDELGFRVDGNPSVLIANGAIILAYPNVLLFAVDEGPDLVRLDLLDRDVADLLVKDALTAIPGQSKDSEYGFLVNSGQTRSSVYPDAFH